MDDDWGYPHLLQDGERFMRKRLEYQAGFGGVQCVPWLLQQR